MKLVPRFAIGLCCYFLLGLNLFIAPVLAGEWETFRSAAGQFSVLFPGKPTPMESTIKTPVGKIPEEYFVFENSGLKLTAEYSSLPNIIIAFVGHNHILKRAAEGYLKHDAGTEISNRKIEIASFPGKEVQYWFSHEEQTFLGTLRLYMVNHRVYALVGKTPKDKADTAGVRKFLNSFQLHGVKKDPKLKAVPSGMQ